METLNTRRNSKQINIGTVAIGGDAPVSVQSMTCSDTRDAQATIRQIKELEEVDCEIVRVAVPDAEAAEALPAIRHGISIPLIADIHFDYRLALQALKAGVDGLRLNPGNIGSRDRVEQVVRSAKERQVPIRIGVNAGSLSKNVDPSLSLPLQMVESAMEHVKILEDLDFDLIKISLKASDVPTTLAAYREMAKRVEYPLHIGITEAGTPRTGIIRSAVGIGALLAEGIGDTIRVSLTTHPREEVIAGWEILKSLNLREHGPTLISCPTCGRTEIDVFGMAEEVERRLQTVKKNIKVAVMGCAVNGPGEAKDADVGIAGGKGKGILFKKGVKVRMVEEKDLVDALMDEVEKL